jgi:GNAT superfamily N-acetyltransferase
MPELKLLDKKGLETYINSEEFQELKIVPISRHRAISHIHNPRCDDADILLILAVEDHQLAGYLGIMPEMIFPAGRPPVKCGWLTCLWVDPLNRGQGIAVQLLRKAHELWNNNILLADYVPQTRKIYDRTGVFSAPQIKSGIRLYIRMDLYSILPPKNNLFSNSKGLLKTIDFVFNAIVDRRFILKNKRYTGLPFEYCEEADREIDTFIAGLNDQFLFKRSSRELNWIRQYPWILSDPALEKTEKRYYFSSVDKLFDLYYIKVRDDHDKLIAFFILSRRNNRLKMPYCFAEPGAIPLIVKIIEFHIVTWKISTFTTFSAGMVKYFSENKTLSLYKKVVERSYLLSSDLTTALVENEFNVQDGDGDQAFT